MKIVRGQSRIVMILPKIGVVIKFPKIEFKMLFLDLKIIIMHKDKVDAFKSFFLEPMKYNSETYPSYFYYYAFCGISSNWNERQFYKRTKNPFLQETYFSLFGLVNVQKLGFQLNQEDSFRKWNFQDQIDRLTNEQARKDKHHWFGPTNFCIEDGKLKIFDYGTTTCEKIIEQYGEKVHTGFNFQENFGVKS